MSNKKLNVLLALTDALATNWKNNILQFTSFFKKEQGQFKGVKKEYTPKDGMVDDPSKRQHTNVVTTVDEKFKWLEEVNKDYINSLFSQEKTNASGTAKAILVVEDNNFGEFTSLELLRLKSLLENGELGQMYENIPVRSDSETWTKSTAQEFGGRNIWEKKKDMGINKSIYKEDYILPDPNITRENAAKYTPQMGKKDTVIEVGEYAVQHFSGEASHLERASILRRRSQLLAAVIVALKEANEVESVPSDMTAEKLFNYLHRGTVPPQRAIASL